MDFGFSGELLIEVIEVVNAVDKLHLRGGHRTTPPETDTLQATESRHPREQVGALLPPNISEGRPG